MSHLVKSVFSQTSDVEKVLGLYVECRLESLVDCGEHGLVLPQEAIFDNIRADYWSSTISAFKPD